MLEHPDAAPHLKEINELDPLTGTDTCDGRTIELSRADRERLAARLGGRRTRRGATTHNPG